MRHELFYISSLMILIVGLLLLVSATIEITYLICVTVNGHTTCHNEVVQSFKIEIFMSGVVTIIISITSILVYTLVIIIINRRKCK